MLCADDLSKFCMISRLAFRTQLWECHERTYPTIASETLVSHAYLPLHFILVAMEMVTTKGQAQLPWLWRMTWSQLFDPCVTCTAFVHLCSFSYAWLRFDLYLTGCFSGLFQLLWFILFWAVFWQVYVTPWMWFHCACVPH